MDIEEASVSGEGAVGVKKEETLDPLKGEAEFDGEEEIIDVKLEKDEKEESAGESAGPRRRVRIAVAGCSHGEMDTIYATMAELEAEQGYKFDLLICCGDYQAVRNYGDMHHVKMPDKYKQIMTFYKYYSGEREAPVLTLFVGGNHEASGFLAELPNGGWVAPKIYYMGYANVIRFAGLRIAGLSGIYGGHDFRKGRYERPPFDQGSLVTAYHVREVDVFRLKQLKPQDEDENSNPIDIMVSHDWPSGIENYGNVDRLLKWKPYFAQDISQGKLGNPSTFQLIHDIRPRYWFAAHLHVGFAALVDHKEAQPTKFLSLDKPIVKRHFLHPIDIEVQPHVLSEDIEFSLSYDPTWLAILKNTDHFTRTDKQIVYMPSKKSSNEKWDYRPTPELLQHIKTLGDLHVPENFEQTAPPTKEILNIKLCNIAPESYYRNPQTAKFCQWLDIGDLNKMLIELNPNEAVGIAYYLVKDSADDNEIKLDDDFGDADFILDNEGRADERVNDESIEDEPSGGVHTTVESADYSIDSSMEDFVAPSWKGKTKSEEGGNEVKTDEARQKMGEGGLVLKRRKIDLNEDEDN